MKDRFGETKLYPGNIMDEPSLSDAEKVLLYQIQFKCRLSKEASTESNETMGIRSGKKKDTVLRLIGKLEKKGWINRLEDKIESTHRQIVLTPKAISLITKPFIYWYLDRVGKFSYPPLTKKHLATIINRKDLERNLPELIQRGWIKD